VRLARRMRQRPCVSTPVPEQHRGRFGGCVEGLGRPRVGLGQHVHHLVLALIETRRTLAAFYSNKHIL
jgi:hypothetical protein